jgi:hypothetical protein
MTIMGDIMGDIIGAHFERLGVRERRIDSGG